MMIIGSGKALNGVRIKIAFFVLRKNRQLFPLKQTQEC